jgi:hypothetical protein
MGGALGVAILGALFNSRLSDLLARIPRSLLGDISTARLKSTPAAIRALPADVQGRVVNAYTDAISAVFLVAAPVCLVAFCVVLMLREQPLRDTAHVGFDGTELVSVAASDA